MDEELCDIYGDLDNFDALLRLKKKTEEYNELETKYGDQLKTIENLKNEIKKLKETHEILQRNFSSLLLTSRSEIKRKDNQIAALRKEKDDICFRRFNHNHHGSSAQANKNPFRDHGQHESDISSKRKYIDSKSHAKSSDLYKTNSKYQDLRIQENSRDHRDSRNEYNHKSSEKYKDYSPTHSNQHSRVKNGDPRHSDERKNLKRNHQDESDNNERYSKRSRRDVNVENRNGVKTLTIAVTMNETSNINSQKDDQSKSKKNEENHNKTTAKVSENSSSIVAEVINLEKNKANYEISKTIYDIRKKDLNKKKCQTSAITIDTKNVELSDKTSKTFQTNNDTREMDAEKKILKSSENENKDLNVMENNNKILENQQSQQDQIKNQNSERIKNLVKEALEAALFDGIYERIPENNEENNSQTLNDNSLDTNNDIYSDLTLNVENKLLTLDKKIIENQSMQIEDPVDVDIRNYCKTLISEIEKDSRINEPINDATNKTDHNLQISNDSKQNTSLEKKCNDKDTMKITENSKELNLIKEQSDTGAQIIEINTDSNQTNNNKPTIESVEETVLNNQISDNKSNEIKSIIDHKSDESVQSIKQSCDMQSATSEKTENLESEMKSICDTTDKSRQCIPKKIKKRQKMIGHKIEGFEPGWPGKKVLEASKLFQEVITNCPITKTKVVQIPENSNKDLKKQNLEKDTSTEPTVEKRKRGRPKKVQIKPKSPEKVAVSTKKQYIQMDPIEETIQAVNSILRIDDHEDEQKDETKTHFAIEHTIIPFLPPLPLKSPPSSPQHPPPPPSPEKDLKKDQKVTLSTLPTLDTPNNGNKNLEIEIIKIDQQMISSNTVSKSHCKNEEIQQKPLHNITDDDELFERVFRTPPSSKCMDINIEENSLNNENSVDLSKDNEYREIENQIGEMFDNNSKENHHEIQQNENEENLLKDKKKLYELLFGELEDDDSPIKSNQQSTPIKKLDEINKISEINLLTEKEKEDKINSNQENTNEMKNNLKNRQNNEQKKDKKKLYELLFGELEDDESPIKLNQPSLKSTPIKKLDEINKISEINLTEEEKDDKINSNQENTNELTNNLRSDQSNEENNEQKNDEISKLSDKVNQDSSINTSEIIIENNMEQEQQQQQQQQNTDDNSTLNSSKDRKIFTNPYTDYVIETGENNNMVLYITRKKKTKKKKKDKS